MTKLGVVDDRSAEGNRSTSPALSAGIGVPVADSESPREQAQTALTLATVDPERAIVASARAEAAARDAQDWAAVSVACRARGVADVQLRHLDSAVAQLRAAIAAARRAGDPELAGEARMSLGPALLLRGQPTQGLSAVKQAIGELQGLPAARARVQRSAMLELLGRLDESLADLRSALPVLRRAGDAEWEVRALSNRSSVYAARRQFRLAEADLIRTWELCDQQGLGLAAAYAEQNLGCVKAARGDVPAALDWLARAGERYAALGVEVGSLRVDRATTLLGVRLLDEARGAAEEAVAILQAQHRVVEVPEAQLILSTVALLQGDNDVAFEAASAATIGFRKLGRLEWLPLARFARLQAQLAPPQGLDWGPVIVDPPAVPAARIRTVADQLEQAGWTVPALEARVVAAMTALREGRQRAARRDLERAAAARRSGPAEVRARAWVAEALLREAEGSRGGAKRALRASVRIVDEHSLSLGAVELRAHVSMHRNAPAQVGLRLALEDHDVAAVHWWGERQRASAELGRSALPPVDPGLARLLEELRATMTEIAEARVAGRSTHTLVTQQTQLERSVRDFARRHPWAGARTAAIPSLGELAAELGRSCLVEYVDHGPDLAAVTMVDGRARLHRLGPSAEVRNILRHLPFAMRRMVQSVGDRRPETAMAVVDNAAEVFERRLLTPIAKVFGDRPLLVVPTGWLQGLPWSLPPSCRGRPVTVAPSATLWQTARNRPRPRTGSVLAIAGPQLPGALTEAQAVAALYPGATLLTGAEASAARVGGMIGAVAICHLAAHGSVRPDNPLFSSLLLADGPFTVFDLEQVGATPRHVVLAACESGVSKVTPGQEILGLTATLLSRQTATVVAPVISIDDAETTSLMVGYHRRLRSGRVPAQALAETQQDALTDADPRLRATAAAFICLGVGDQLPGGSGLEMDAGHAQDCLGP